MAEYELRKTWITWIPLSQIIILVCGTLLCYIIAYSKGDVSVYLPFISETGAYSPEKCIFSLSLILGSFLGCIMCLLYFIMMKDNSLSNEKFFNFINIGAFIIGLLSMLGLAGVAAFPMTTVFWAHLCFAALYFAGSASYFILLAIITYKTEGKTRKLYFRVAVSISITFFLFFIVIVFPISLTRWHKYNDFIPALKTPNNQGFTLLLLSSILEWLIVICIIIYNSTLLIDFKNYSFKVGATSDAAKNIPVTENPIPVPTQE